MAISPRGGTAAPLRSLHHHKPARPDCYVQIPAVTYVLFRLGVVGAHGSDRGASSTDIKTRRRGSGPELHASDLTRSPPALSTGHGRRLRSACFCASCAALSWALVYIRACSARSRLSSQRLRQMPRMPSSGCPTTRDEKDSKVIGPL